MAVAAAWWLLTAAAILLPAVDDAILAGRVEQLPGWPSKLPSVLYSGFLSVPGDYGQKQVITMSSPSRRATRRPVALWLNGGPGSSSLIGWLTENGQYMTIERSLTEPLWWPYHSPWNNPAAHFTPEPRNAFPPGEREGGPVICCPAICCNHNHNHYLRHAAHTCQQHVSYPVPCVACVRDTAVRYIRGAWCSSISSVYLLG